KAFREGDRQWSLCLAAPPRGDPPRRGVGWSVRDPHRRAETTVVGRGRGALVQAVGFGGASVPVVQRARSAGTAHPPPGAAPGAGAPVFVHVGLLRGVGVAALLGAFAVCRRGFGRDPAAARPGGCGRADRIGAGEEEDKTDRLRFGGAELSEFAGAVGRPDTKPVCGGGG